MAFDNPYAAPSPSASFTQPAVKLEAPQSVNFQLTEDEVLHVVEHINTKNRTYQNFLRTRQRRLIVIASIGAVLAGLIAWSESIWNPPFLVFAVVSASCFLSALLLPLRSKKLSLRLSRDMIAQERNSIMDRKVKATLLADGFESADQDGHSYRKWSSIESVDRTDRMLFVFLTSGMAHGIPSRAFMNEAAFLSFCELAARLWRQANPGLEDDQ